MLFMDIVFVNKQINKYSFELERNLESTSQRVEGP